MSKAKQMLATLELCGLLGPTLDGFIDGFVYANSFKPKPKIKLSPEFNCSDEFRLDMNAWLLDMFGSEEVRNTDLPWCPAYAAWR